MSRRISWLHNQKWPYQMQWKFPLAKLSFTLLPLYEDILKTRHKNLFCFIWENKFENWQVCMHAWSNSDLCIDCRYINECIIVCISVIFHESKNTTIFKQPSLQISQSLKMKKGSLKVKKKKTRLISLKFLKKYFDSFKTWIFK